MYVLLGSIRLMGSMINLAVGRLELVLYGFRLMRIGTEQRREHTLGRSF